MSTDLSGVSQTQYQQQIAQLFSALGISPTGADGDEIPPSQQLGDELLATLKDLSQPVLSAPVGGLSLDTLLTAIGDTVRRQAVKDGIDSLELKGEQQAEVNEQQLAEMKEQLEKMRSKSILDGFLKAFQIIGAIVGAIASVATIVAGVMTGNPLLIAAGVIGAVMTVDSVVSLASDGKYSISAGITELCKAMGMDEKAAAWVAMAIQLALCVVTIGLSLGAGLASSSGAVINTASQATQRAFDAIQMAQKIANFANAAVQVGTGAVTIGATVVNYETEQSKADMKELEAILERIRASIEMDQDMVEEELERANALLEAVKDIVSGNVETQGALLATAPPAMV